MFRRAVSTLWPLLPGSDYRVDVSFAGNIPGVPVPGVGVIPLNEPVLFGTYGTAFPAIFTGFVGSLNAAGTVTASFTTPAHPALVGFTLYAACVTYDPLGPFDIGRIGNSVSTLFTL